MNTNGCFSLHNGQLSYCLDGRWYHVIHYGTCWWEAEVLGQWASGMTPELAIRNAIRLHQPQPSEEESEE